MNFEYPPKKVNTEALHRLEGESYKVYKLRRKYNQLKTKQILNGNIKRTT